MGAARHGVFIHSQLWRENTTHAVKGRIIGLGSYGNKESIQHFHFIIIGFKISHSFRIFQNEKQVSINVGFKWPDSQCRFHFIRDFYSTASIGWKIHFNHIPAVFHDKFSNHCTENELRRFLIKPKQNVSRPQCGVTAKVDLTSRRKPSQVIPVAFLDCECGLREIVLSCNALHEGVRYPVIQHANSRLVSMKNPVRKSINDVLLHLSDSSHYRRQQPLSAIRFHDLLHEVVDVSSAVPIFRSIGDIIRFDKDLIIQPVNI